MSINELSEFTGFSPSKIRNDMKSGRITYLKVGRRLLFLKNDVIAYLERHRVHTPEPETVN
jgi:excisionase family DNA binding protein